MKEIRLCVVVVCGIAMVRPAEAQIWEYRQSAGTEAVAVVGESGGTPGDYSRLLGVSCGALGPVITEFSTNPWDHALFEEGQVIQEEIVVDGATYWMAQRVEIHTEIIAFSARFYEPGLLEHLMNGSYAIIGLTGFPLRGSRSAISRLPCT